MRASSLARTLCHRSVGVDTQLHPPRLTRHLGRAVLPLLVVAALLGSTRPRLVAAEGAASTTEPRVLPQLQRQAALQPDGTFRVIVTRIGDTPAIASAAASEIPRERKESPADRHVVAGGGRKIRELRHDAFVAELSGHAIADLGRDPAVKFVAPDAQMQAACMNCNVFDPSQLATIYPQAIQASALWSSAGGTAAWTGAGVAVAVVDTGISMGLPDFRDSAGGSRIVKQVDFSSLDDLQSDGRGHGTHVAGIIAGNSWFRNAHNVQGKYMGVAPAAQLIDVKVANADGMSYLSDVVDAIDWVVANRETYNIRVMNLSLVSSVPESYTTSTIAAAVERAWFSGILVVVAAGNAGSDTLQYPPANDPFVITVGASDPRGTATPADDGLAPWSSYGTSQDGIVKPDIVAPGRYIIAPLASQGCSLARTLPDRIVDRAYIWLSGTSMAAPVVAGVAALAFQAHPDWTNDQLKSVLLQTGRHLDDPGIPPIGQGAGEVDAGAVVGYRDLPPMANQGIPINGQLVGPDGALIYNSQPGTTWSTSTWSTSTWSTSTWSTSTWSTSNWSTSTWSASTQWTSADIE